MLLCRYFLLLALVIILPSNFGSDCGSGGGQGWCASEWCCSYDSWCGQGVAWCGTGCQNGYGACSSINTTFSLPGPNYFHGSNYLYYPSLPSALGFAFSISFWITPQANIESAVVSMGRSPENYDNEFVVTMHTSGEIEYYEFNTGYGYGVSLLTPSTLSAGIRTHIAIVRLGTEGALYINGVESITNKASIPDGIIIQNSDFVIGKDYRDGNGFFIGSIDNVNIYLTALMAAQITDIYQQQRVALSVQHTTTLQSLRPSKPSDAPSAQPVYDISTQENALCDLLNISPNQKTFLTLTCNASAPSGSRFSSYPCESEYFGCNIYGEINSISNVPICGNLPSSIGYFSALESLRLDSSQLTGLIPSTIGNLSNLRLLGLSSNHLTGPIPSSIGNLINLQDLDLSSNQLTGPIPSTIGNLIKLQKLYLNSNILTGPIPSTIGNLINLQDLYLYSNKLAGPIPSTIGNLRNLQYLNLFTNQLTGLIPSTIGNLINLKRLYLDSNKLTGPIPSTSRFLFNLQLLVLSYNQLTGPIPSSIGQLSNLRLLGLTSNQLTGPIPSTIGNLINLQNLYLSFNQLTGPIPSTIGNLINLQNLYLSFNQLTGPIYFSVGSLTKLQALVLCSNNLTGPIPSTIGNLIHLRYLQFYSNQLTGPIPSTIGNLIHLRYLQFYSNQLTGPIPSTIGNSISLQHLNLSSNQLTGPLPVTIQNLINLELLDLSFNELTGPIPKTFGNLQGITDIVLIHNKLNGTIPPELCALQLLSFLSLAGNRFECYPTCLSSKGDYMSAYKHCHSSQDIALCDLASAFALLTKMKSLLITSQLVLQYSSSDSFPYHQSVSVENAVSYSLVFDAKTWQFFREHSLLIYNSQGKICFSSHYYQQSPYTLPGVGTTPPLVIADSAFSIQTYEILNDLELSSGRYYITVTAQSTGIGWNCTTTQNASSESNSSRPVLVSYAPNFCSWTGITCAKGTSVTSLVLRGYGLQGLFPSSIGLLTSLTQLDVSFNKLRGSLPTSLAKLVSLNLLDISSNLLNGTIATGIQSLSQLSFFSCSNNYFSGPLPIFTADSLIQVFLDANHFEGTIFAELCHPMVNFSSGLVSMTGNAKLTCYETCWIPFARQNIFDPWVKYCAPSSQPSTMPTMPTSQPSSMPSSAPSKPSCQPSNQPSSTPSLQPNNEPTIQPITIPSLRPLTKPSIQPLIQPTRQPSAQPSNCPSSPSSKPSSFPSLQPTLQPTAVPSTPTTVIPLTSSFVLNALNGSIIGACLLFVSLLLLFFGSRMLLYYNRRSYYQGLPVHLAIVLGRKAPYIDDGQFDLAYLVDKDKKTALDLLLERYARSLDDDILTFEYVHRLVSNDLPVNCEDKQQCSNSSSSSRIPISSTVGATSPTSLYFKWFHGQWNRSSKIYLTIQDEDKHSSSNSLHVGSSKRCVQGYSWTVIVQREEDYAVQLVERILTAKKDKSDILSYSTDAFGRRHMDIASTKCKLVLNKFRYLHGRYDLKLGPPEHKSKTGMIKLATDRISADGKPVALKFMKFREQFISEVRSRSMGDFSSDIVMAVLKSYDGDSDDHDDVLFRQDATFKGFSQYPYCVVMDVADQNLQKLIFQQNICGKEWDDIRNITRQIALALEHIHSKGIVHGDIKPTNIVLTGQKLRLIDFETSASIEKSQYLGAKYSSAYIPPELLFYSESESCGKVIIRSFEKPPGELVTDFNFGHQFEYPLLLAAPSFDHWSFGAVLYLLCTGETLFKASVEDNSSDSELLQLFEWSDRIKKKKLAIVTNKHARNLISLLLCKNPIKRLSAKYVLSHPFLTGKNPSRMQGEPAKFDVFLSYRVNSDSDHVAMLYDALTTLGMTVWLDKECLLPGQLWEEGFCNGLINSATFVCLLSRGAINNADKPRQCFSRLTSESMCDNVLLEWNMALELRQRDMLDCIYPVFVGDKDIDGTSYGDYFPTGCHPQSLPEVVVTAVTDKLQEHLDNQGLGAVYMEQETVKQVVDSICSYQGGFLRGNIVESLSHIVDQISYMVTTHKAKFSLS